MASSAKKPVTVYYDGACPLCVREIGLLRRLDGRRKRLMFENIADPNALVSCDINREKLLARFHVRRSDGVIVDGAAAFTEAYGQIPYLSWARPLGRIGFVRKALDGLYSMFLKVRPMVQRTLRSTAG